MNSEGSRSRASAHGSGSLILPAGPFGPVYRDRTASNERRSAWVRFQRWMSFLLGAVPAIAFIGFAQARWPEQGPLIALDHPVLFWSALAAITIAGWLTGIVWARVQGERLAPVAWRSMGVDDRLEAHFLPKPTAHIAALMGLLIANLFLVAAIALAALFLHPWIFGPWAALQGIWTLGFLRACVLRHRLETGRPARSLEASGP